MKQLTVAILLLLSFSGFCQEGTTLEEYRYLSKGYVYQLEMGLDADKDGYEVKKLFTASNNARLIALYKSDRPEARAILVIIEEADQKPVYICIPNQESDERVKNLYNLDQKNLNRLEVKEQYEKAMQEFLFTAISDKQKPQVPLTIQPSPARQSFPDAFDKTETLVVKGDQQIQTVPDPVFESLETVEIPKATKTVKAEQNTSGAIAGRAIVFSPEVSASAYKRGLVAVKVCVNKEGFVTSAKFTQRGSTTFDHQLKKAAVDSASKYRFDKSDVPEQCGIITFKF